MPRGRIYNFHDARFSVAQSAIRENVVQRPRGHTAPGLFAEHPIMEAAGAALELVSLREAAAAPAVEDRHGGPVAEEFDAQVVLAEYDARRDAHRLAGVVVAEARGLEVCLDLMAKYILAWAVGAHRTMVRIARLLTARDGPCDFAGGVEILEQWLAAYWRGQKPAYNPPRRMSRGPFRCPPPRPARCAWAYWATGARASPRRRRC